MFILIPNPLSMRNSVLFNNTSIFTLNGLKQTYSANSMICIIMWHSHLNDMEIPETKHFIPKGFQKHLLTRKMETIPLRPFYCNICTKLDVERQFFDDYRLLGEKIGLSTDEIILLEQRGQPTHCMLQRFKSQKNSSVGKFKNIMEEMDRHDIVTIIDEWISYEWGKENNPAAPLV